MPKAAQIHKFEAGQRKCPICDRPLPAHETWPGARYRFCGEPECVEAVQANKTGRYIGPNQYKCDGPQCENFVPTGLYSKIFRVLTCSSRCSNRREWKGTQRLTCGCGCGLDFLGKKKRNNVDGLVFISSQHRGTYIRNKYLRESCGVFLGLATEYLDGFASRHYREIRTPRLALSPFFRFLTKHGIKSIGKVTPKTITQFLTWAKQQGIASPAYNISKI